MADEENPFLISAPEDDGGQAAEDALMAQQLMRDVAEGEQGLEGGGSNRTQEDTSVEGLIPLCAKEAGGPMMNTAVYGYDVSQMQDRPWTKPGANMSDYFNYGFNESTWRVYCAMQPNGNKSVLAKANDFAQSQGLDTAQLSGGQGDDQQFSATRFGGINQNKGSSGMGMMGGGGGGNRMMRPSGVCHQWLQHGRCDRMQCKFAHVDGPGGNAQSGGGVGGSSGGGGHSGLMQPPSMPPPMPPPSGLLDMPHGMSGMYPPMGMPPLPMGIPPPPGMPPFPGAPPPMNQFQAGGGQGGGGGGGFRMPPKQGDTEGGLLDEPSSKRQRRE